MQGKEDHMQGKEGRNRENAQTDVGYSAQTGENVFDEHILQTQLQEYAAGELYPFHMPGHKRRFAPAPGLPFEWDVTEVPGTDDLHDASGILREAMERTAKQCGSDRTWYLVNGSTCGLLAGIRSLARRGSEVICARNCHKAVYHALELAGCKVHWIMPVIDSEWGICGGISAAQVEKQIRRHPSVKAVILTSPTYEGVLSDIRGICEVCHSKGIPVLVDEAHGAHLLPMSEQEGFPAGALACGADIVVQSPHKTLPSLTQTALLHLQGDLADPDRIENELDIFETSSPSYPLMASLDGCTGILRARGTELFARWAARIGRFDKSAGALKKIRILYHTPAPAGAEKERPSIPAVLFDPGKILMDASGLGMTGPELAGVLRDQWKIETEMARGDQALAMTSLCDDEDALDRLVRALMEIEASAEDLFKKSAAGNNTENAAENTAGDTIVSGERKRAKSPGVGAALTGLKPVTICSLSEACEQDPVRVPLADAAERICAQYMYFYPPGIPFLAPGELITPQILRLLAAAQEAGGTAYRGGDGSVLCLRE